MYQLETIKHIHLIATLVWVESCIFSVQKERRALGMPGKPLCLYPQPQVDV